MTTAPLRAAAEAAGAQELDDEPLSPTLFEAELRDLARSRYHDRHPFNLRMHRGELSPDELRTWVSNRFHYQRSIPVKDALILAKLPEPSMRRSWLRRIQDHDGLVDGQGGIERWLRLGEAVGLSRSQVVAGAHVLPGVRLAVDGYVNFAYQPCAGGRRLLTHRTVRTEHHDDPSGDLPRPLPVDRRSGPRLLSQQGSAREPGRRRGTRLGDRLGADPQRPAQGSVGTGFQM